MEELTPNYHTHNGMDSPFIDRDANNISNIFKGTDTPTNTKTVPKKIGDKYIDTTNRKVYFATQISNPPAVGDWTIVN